MKIKKNLTFVFCLITLFLKSKNVLPYTQGNICLDQLINVNANAISYIKNLVVVDLNKAGIKEVAITDATASMVKIYSFIPASAIVSLQNFFTVHGTFDIGTINSSVNSSLALKDGHFQLKQKITPTIIGINNAVSNFMNGKSTDVTSKIAGGNWTLSNGTTISDTFSGQVKGWIEL